EELLDCVTLDDSDFQTFARQVVEEVLALGRVGVLVDYADGNPGRPYLALYTAEACINWQARQVAGDTVLSRVILRVVGEEDTADEFVQAEIEQYRVLDLDEAGYYRQRVFRKKETRNDQGQVMSTSWEQEGEDIYPSMRGERLRFLPFLFIGAADLCAD